VKGILCLNLDVIHIYCKFKVSIAIPFSDNTLTCEYKVLLQNLTIIKTWLTENALPHAK